MLKLEQFPDISQSQCDFQSTVKYLKTVELWLGYKNEILSDFLASFHFEELPYEFAKLTDIFDTLEYSIERVGNQPYHILVEYLTNLAKRDLRFGHEVVTDYNLSKLIANLADIKDGSSFYDFAAGYGISAIECIKKKKNIEATLQDTQRKCSAVNIMLLIIAGIHNAQVFCRDSFRQPEIRSSIHKQYDYIICDPPLGLKIPVEELYHSKIMENRLDHNIFFLDLNSDKGKKYIEKSPKGGCTLKKIE